MSPKCAVWGVESPLVPVGPGRSCARGDSCFSMSTASSSDMMSRLPDTWFSWGSAATLPLPSCRGRHETGNHVSDGEPYGRSNTRLNTANGIWVTYQPVSADSTTTATMWLQVSQNTDQDIVRIRTLPAESEVGGNGLLSTANVVLRTFGPLIFSVAAPPLGCKSVTCRASLRYKHASCGAILLYNDIHHTSC